MVQVQLLIVVFWEYLKAGDGGDLREICHLFSLLQMNWAKLLKPKDAQILTVSRASLEFLPFLKKILEQDPGNSDLIFAAFDFLSHLLDGIYFFFRELGSDNETADRIVFEILKFSFEMNVFNEQNLIRFLSCLKMHVRNSTKDYFCSDPNPTRPLCFRRYTLASGLEFAFDSFGIDFRELLINKQSFGNPIGVMIMMLDYLEKGRLECVGLYKQAFRVFSIFCVMNENINPLVFENLRRLYSHIKALPEGEAKSDFGTLEKCNFEHLIGPECEIIKLYELIPSNKAGKSFFFAASWDLELKGLSLEYSMKVLNSCMGVVRKMGQLLQMESLYQLQAYNLIWKSVGMISKIKAVRAEREKENDKKEETESENKNKNQNLKSGKEEFQKSIEISEIVKEEESDLGWDESTKHFAGSIFTGSLHFANKYLEKSSAEQSAYLVSLLKDPLSFEVSGNVLGALIVASLRKMVLEMIRLKLSKFLFGSVDLERNAEKLNQMRESITKMLKQ